MTSYEILIQCAEILWAHVGTKPVPDRDSTKARDVLFAAMMLHPVMRRSGHFDTAGSLRELIDGWHTSQAQWTQAWFSLYHEAPYPRPSFVEMVTRSHA